MNTEQSSNVPEYFNATVDEVSAWADRAGERGLLNATTARLKVAALRRIITVLADDEHMGANEMLANLDALVMRLGRKEGGSPDTLSTYKQRAESLLRDFLEYQKDPAGFQTKSADRPPKAAKAVADKKPTEKKKVDVATPAADSETPVDGGRRFVFPLGGSREFAYWLPAGGITMSEVKRIMFHLGSMASDFDPSAKDISELTRRISSSTNDDE